MKPIDPQEWKQDLPAFREKTAAFYKGELKKNDYKGFSGLYGSYAQKDGKASMLRLLSLIHIFHNAFLRLPSEGKRRKGRAGFSENQELRRVKRLACRSSFLLKLSFLASFPIVMEFLLKCKDFLKKMD